MTASHRVLIEKHLPVEMRDGVHLSTDVYRAEDADQHPVVLIRTPYGKDVPGHANTWINVVEAVERGWIVVVQDVRGRYRSAGSFVPFVNEGRDGFDSVAWIRNQPWSDGAVGMVGGSYVGMSQWLAAAEDPPGLIGIVPAVAPDDITQDWLREGGNLAFGFLANWVATLLTTSPIPDAAAKSRITQIARDVIEERIRTFEDLVAAAGPFAPYLSDWRNPAFEGAPPRLAGRVRVPALVIGGWFDIFVRGSVASYARRDDAGSRHAGDRLILGPWAHGVMGGWFPTHWFGEHSSYESLHPTALQLNWLEAVRTGAFDDSAPVRAFVMGLDEWQQFDRWPPEDVVPLELRLRVTNAVDPSHVVATPAANPVGTVGGRTFLPGLWIAANSGPRPLGAATAGGDSLSFSSEPFVEDVDVVGPIVCEVHAMSQRPTLIVAKASVISADGTAELFAEGSSQLPGGDGFRRISIDLGPTALRLTSGAKLRADISASDFPRLEDGPRSEVTIAALGDEPVLHLMIRPV